MEAGFDNSLYIHKQTEHIRQRIAQWGGKLYLEFGGKLFDDYHASRVLPGFQPDSKIKMLMELRDSVEIVIVINATDIEKNKVRSDLGITYAASASSSFCVAHGRAISTGTPHGCLPSRYVRPNSAA